MPKYQIEMRLVNITFDDLDDVKRFINAINETEGKRLKFKLILIDIKKGKRIKESDKNE